MKKIILVIFVISTKLLGMHGVPIVLGSNTSTLYGENHFLQIKHNIPQIMPLYYYAFCRLNPSQLKEIDRRTHTSPNEESMFLIHHNIEYVILTKKDNPNVTREELSKLSFCQSSTEPELSQPVKYKDMVIFHNKSQKKYATRSTDFLYTNLFD